MNRIVRILGSFEKLAGAGPAPAQFSPRVQGLLKRAEEIAIMQGKPTTNPVDVEEPNIIPCEGEPELIPGGKAEGKGAPEIAKDLGEDEEKVDEALDQGKAVETEHTDDGAKAREIAKDHVDEAGPEYYDKLKGMEETLKGERDGTLTDPSHEDKLLILRYLQQSTDLDDETMHKLFMSLGVDPHEAEEFVYAVAKDDLEGAGDKEIESKAKAEEVEEEDEEDEKDEDKGETKEAAAKAPAAPAAAPAPAPVPANSAQAAADAQLAKLKRAAAEAKAQARAADKELKMFVDQRSDQESQAKLETATTEEAQAKQALTVAQQQEQLQAQAQAAPFASMANPRPQKVAAEKQAADPAEAINKALKGRREMLSDVELPARDPAPPPPANPPKTGVATGSAVGGAAAGSKAVLRAEPNAEERQRLLAYLQADPAERLRMRSTVLSRQT